MSLLDELNKRQMNGFAPSAPAPFQLDAPAPAASPTVGPTLANAAALPQAPAPAGAMPQAQGQAGAPTQQGAMPELRDVSGNPMAMPSVQNVAPTPVDLVPSLSDPATRTRDLAGTGSGALIDTPSSGGFAGIEEGISEAVGAAPIGVATPAPSTPAPLADTNMGAGLAATAAPQPSPPTLQAPQPQGLTTAGGQPLAEFLAGGQQLDPQGRMIDPSVDRSSFEQESAAREQRAAEGFGEARGPDSRDRDRRGTMSKADAVKLTGGDRAAADALLKRQELGLGEFAPEKETRSPEQIEQEKLANERTRQIIEAGNKPEATGFQKGLAKQEEQWQSAADAGILEDWEVDAQRKDYYKKPAPSGYASWVEYEADKRGNTAPPESPASEGEVATTEGESGDVLMIGTDGKTRKVPAKDKEAALEAGYTLK